MCCCRVCRKHNTHPREYVSIYVSFTEKKQYSNVCVLLELLTQLKSNEEKHN